MKPLRLFHAYALALALAAPLAAQLDPMPAVPRSVHVYLASEAAWRGLVTADGLALRSALTLPLLTRPATGGLTDGLQLELDGWTRLAGDPGPVLADQYAAGVRYVTHPGGSRRPASYVSAHYRGYLHTADNRLGEDVTHEVAVSGGYELRSASQGLQGFVAHAEAAHDFGAVDGTSVQAGIAAAFPFPTVQWVDFFADGALRFSDYDGALGDREFSYGGAEAQLGARFPTFLRDILLGRATVVPRVGLGLAHGPDGLERNTVSVFAGLSAEF